MSERSLISPGFQQNITGGKKDLVKSLFKRTRRLLNDCFALRTH